VHDEAVRDALGPLGDEVLLRQAVIGGVGLDRVEMLGVEAKSFLS
jgi:hypothetical protein